MISDICLNCKAILHPGDKFCSQCGQKTNTHRINMYHIWHDLFHAFTHTDKGIIYLIKELIYRPGYVAKEYVEGQRKKYFNPFSFLVIVVAIATFFIASFNLMADPQRQDPITLFLNKHANFIIFLNVPLGALFSWLFFIRSGKTYAENLVLAAYTSGERSVVYTLFIAPLMVSFREFYMFWVYAYMVLWFIYLGWSCTQFFDRKNIWGFIGGFLVGVCEQLIVYSLIYAAYVIYYTYYYRR